MKIKIKTIRDIVNIIKSYHLYINPGANLSLDFDAYKKWLDTEIELPEKSEVENRIEAIKGVE